MEICSDWFVLLKKRRRNIHILLHLQRYPHTTVLLKDTIQSFAEERSFPDAVSNTSHSCSSSCLYCHCPRHFQCPFSVSLPPLSLSFPLFQVLLSNPFIMGSVIFMHKETWVSVSNFSSCSEECQMKCSTQTDSLCVSLWQPLPSSNSFLSFRPFSWCSFCIPLQGLNNRVCFQMCIHWKVVSPVSSRLSCDDCPEVTGQGAMSYAFTINGHKLQTWERSRTLFKELSQSLFQDNDSFPLETNFLVSHAPFRLLLFFESFKINITTERFVMNNAYSSLTITVKSFFECVETNLSRKDRQ